MNLSLQFRPVFRIDVYFVCVDFDLVMNYTLCLIIELCRFSNNSSSRRIIFNFRQSQRCMFFPCILKTSAFIECLAGCFYRNPRGQSVGKYVDLAESLQKKNYTVSLRQWLQPIFWKLRRSVFTNLGKFLFHTSVSVSLRFVLPAECISWRSCSCW